MYGRAAFVHYGRWWLRVGRWIVLAAALVGCGYAFWQTSLQSFGGELNPVSELEYQSLVLTVETHPDLTPDVTKGVSQPLQDWFPRRTQGILNPLFPWIMAWQVDDAHALGSQSGLTDDDRQVILSGRLMLTALVFSFIVILTIACARVISIPAALITAMLCGWGVLFPASQSFTPDALFTVLFLITWVGCLLAMPRNSLWAYAVVGISSGLAYMAAESAQLLVVVFIAVTTLRWLWGWIAAHWPGHGSTTLWVRRNHFMGLFLLIALHLLTIGPRLNYAYQEFGDPFHSVKRQAMWLDSPTEVDAWMETDEQPSSTPVERPSWALYAASHSQEQMWARLQRGFSKQWQSFLSPPHLRDAPIARSRGTWLLALGGLLASIGVILACLRREEDHAGQRLHPETGTMTLFVLAATAAYTLAGAWGTPLGKGAGFADALVAPLALSVVWACESLLRRARRRHASLRLFIAYECILWIIFAAMAWQVIEMLQPASFGT